MAKYRHRLFEMYETPAEAALALTPNASRPTGMPERDPRTEDSESWTFKHLVVSRANRLTHVRFPKAHSITDETVDDLREDFNQLADKLEKDSRVLLDFSGVTEIGPGSIDVLAQFRQKLRTRGSRMVLSGLAPAPRQSFFDSRSPNL